MSELITKQRLKDYKDRSCLYDNALACKHRYEKMLQETKPTDPPIKYRNQYMPASQYYTKQLENVTNHLEKHKKKLESEYEIIYSNINQIKKPLYQDILIRFYFEGQTISQIADFICSNKPDYEEQKKDKYIPYVKYWKARAIKELERNWKKENDIPIYIRKNKAVKETKKWH